jgi:hypothetical protein
MNGYRAHLLCRSVVRVDANEKQNGWQVAKVLFSSALSEKNLTQLLLVNAHHFCSQAGIFPPRLQKTAWGYVAMT